MRTGRPPGPGSPAPQPPEPGRGQLPRPWLWRIRRNPLRRTADLVEAWVILIVWIVAAVGGVFAGAVTGSATADSLHQQRTERHAVTARLLADTRQAPATGADGNRVQAKVSWTDPHGVTHTGTTLVGTGHHAGYQIRIWTDRQNRITHAPAGDAETALQSVMMGGAAAAAFGGLTYATGRGVRFGIDHHRAAAWDKEWAAVEPWWAHRTR